MNDDTAIDVRVRWVEADDKQGLNSVIFGKEELREGIESRILFVNFSAYQ